jgi:uncharacterized protein (DUF1800 family)
MLTSVAQVSNQERIAHVLRRLSMGAHPDLIGEVSDTDAAIAKALDLPGGRPVPPAMAVPVNYRTTQPTDIIPLIGWWLDQMRSPSRMIEERLVWFWHDHFATSIAKVRAPYLLRQQQVTIREHATGSFADLLHAIAKDPAMLIFLDGITNTVGQINENFGRECMELFTMGRQGGYTQADVVAASQSFSGWVPNLPGIPALDRLTALGIAPWTAGFIPRRHDDSVKTLLGRRGAFDLDQALDIILDQPATGLFVATKLYRQLVGQTPSHDTAARLGKSFGHDYQIPRLVEAITADPAFTADAAVRSRVRTPVERLVGILQAAGKNLSTIGPRATVAANVLHTIDFLPFLPPNVGGFPAGTFLLGPHDLVTAFDLLDTLGGPPPTPTKVDALLARFGIFDVSSTSQKVLSAEPDPARRFALAAMSPEFAVT